MSALESNEIDVEEIMKKVRENIRKRKGDQNYSQMEKMNQTLRIDSDMDRVQQNIKSINSYCDIRNDDYYICSHKPLVGKVLVEGRKLTHGEVRRYLDPIIGKQIEFNQFAAGLFDETFRKLDESNKAIELKVNALDLRIRIMENLNKNSNVPNYDASFFVELLHWNTCIQFAEEIVYARKLRGSYYLDTPQKIWDLNLCLNAIEYFDINLSGKILDVGCGQNSQILKALSRKGFKDLTGIDTSIEESRSDGLTLFRKDLLDNEFHLINKDKFDMIFCISVIEHDIFNTEKLYKFFIGMYEMLRDNGILVITFDYWPNKIEINSNFWGGPWNIFSREEVSEMINIAKSIGFKQTNEFTHGIPFPCVTIKMDDKKDDLTKYTFASLLFVKGGI